MSRRARVARRACLAAALAILLQAAAWADRFPSSPWPADPPAAVALGRLLFYDRALSVNGTLSCADCHLQARAFTDGRRVAVGATGEHHRRNTPSLANAAWFSALGWSDPMLWRLDAQHRIPLFGRDPLEQGLVDPLPDAVRAWADDSDPAQLANSVTAMLAAFVRSLVSDRSPFDAWLFDDDARALSPQARKGYELFASERLECTRCHDGFLLGGAVRTHTRQQAPRFARNGVPHRANDRGLAEHTGTAEDVGAFRVPSLRNVMLTAPYMHDGSLPTIDAVLDHYSAGVAASGSEPALPAFVLTAEERGQLIAFFEALTDARFVTAAAYGDPWVEAP